MTTEPRLSASVDAAVDAALADHATEGAARGSGVTGRTVRNYVEEAKEHMYKHARTPGPDPCDTVPSPPRALAPGPLQYLAEDSVLCGCGTGASLEVLLYHALAGSPLSEMTDDEREALCCSVSSAREWGGTRCSGPCRKCVWYEARVDQTAPCVTNEMRFVPCNGSDLAAHNPGLSPAEAQRKIEAARDKFFSAVRRRPPLGGR